MKVHEAMRDLVRARAAAVETLRVHRQHVSAFILKHARIYPRKKGWTMRYLRWLQEQPFGHPAHQIALRKWSKRSASVDRTEPWPDGPDCQEDQALPV